MPKVDPLRYVDVQVESNAAHAELPGNSNKTEDSQAQDPAR